MGTAGGIARAIVRQVAVEGRGGRGADVLMVSLKFSFASLVPPRFTSAASLAALQCA
jgi:hypothetical protein